MKFELDREVALARDIPESRLRVGDVATLIDFVPHQDGEEGVVLEVFNAIGESIFYNETRSNINVWAIAQTLG